MAAAESSPALGRVHTSKQLDRTATASPSELASRRQSAAPNQQAADRTNTMRRMASKAAVSTEAVGKENLKSTLSVAGRAQKKCVALIAEETQEAFKKRFTAKQKDGTIKLETFFDILAELQEVYDCDGVVYNAGLVHKMYHSAGEGENEDMTHRDCQVLIGRFIGKCQEHDRRLVAEAAARTKTQDGKPIDYVYVPFGEYVSAHATCKPRKQGTPAVYWAGLGRFGEANSLFVLAGLAIILLASLVVGIEAGSAFDSIRGESRRGISGVERMLEGLNAGYGHSVDDTLDRVISGLSTKMSPSTAALVDSSLELFRAIALSRTRAFAGEAHSLMLSEVDRVVTLMMTPLSVLVDADTAWLDTTVVLTAEAVVTVLTQWARDTQGDAAVGYLSTADFSAISTALYASPSLTRSDATNLLSAGYYASNGTVQRVDVTVAGVARFAVCAAFTGTNARSTSDTTKVLVACTSFRRAAVLPAIFAKLAQYEAARRTTPPSCRIMFSDPSAATPEWLLVNSTWTPIGSPVAAPQVQVEFSQGADATGGSRTFSNTFPDILVSDTPLRRPGNGVNYEYYFAVEYVPSLRLRFCSTCGLDADAPSQQFAVATATNLAGTDASIVKLVQPTSAALANGQPGIVLVDNKPLLVTAYSDDVTSLLAAYAVNTTLTTRSRNANGILTVSGVFSAPKINSTFTSALQLVEIRVLASEQLTVMYSGISNRTNGTLAIAYMVDAPNGRLEYAYRPPVCRVGLASCPVPAAAQRAFAYRSTRTDDSIILNNGVAHRAQFGYEKKENVVIGVAVPSANTENLGWMFTGFLMIIAAVMLVSGSIVMRIWARMSLDRIETEYLEYKTQIENEKIQFSELVKDVMPSFISARIILGEKLIVDQHPQLTFLFSDIVGCGDLCRHASMIEMVRLLGYTFMLQDIVGEYYHIHKLKTIGDAFFCVSGLEDVARKKEVDDLKKRLRSSGASDAAIAEAVVDFEATHHMDNQVLRMVSFAVVTQQLLGVEYVHYPERTECFLECAGQDLGKMNMVSMQMGIHCGNAIAGVVDVGRAPHFDCFGPSVNLASRMETTAPIDRLQISAPTFELLKNCDKNHEFEFEAPKKTLIKGYGTMNTYTIRSTTLRVPEEIIAKIRCDRAVRLRHWNETGIVITSDAPDDGGDLAPSSSSRFDGSESGAQPSPQHH